MVMTVAAAEASVGLAIIAATNGASFVVLLCITLAGGLLGGALERAEAGRRAGEQAQKNIDKHRAKLEAYEELCRKLGEKPATVALAWLLHNPVVTAPIIGPRTVEQLESSIRAAELVVEAVIAAHRREDGIPMHVRVPVI